MVDGLNKQEMAEERTDWAEDRTIMANERTFAGWMRTGMASIALALGMRAVFRPVEHDWIAKAVATIFLLVAIFIFWQAWRNARDTHDRLDERNVEALPSKGYGRLAAMLSLGAVATGAILWSL